MLVCVSGELACGEKRKYSVLQLVRAVAGSKQVAAGCVHGDRGWQRGVTEQSHSGHVAEGLPDTLACDTAHQRASIGSLGHSWAPLPCQGHHCPVETRAGSLFAVGCKGHWCSRKRLNTPVWLLNGTVSNAISAVLKQKLHFFIQLYVSILFTVLLVLRRKETETGADF